MTTTPTTPTAPSAPSANGKRKPSLFGQMSPEALAQAAEEHRCLQRGRAEAARPGLPDWAQELHEWWTATADSDISGSIQKIVDYGGRGAAYDLIATGHDLAAMNGRQVGDEEATELAILFYASSKLNRLMAAAIDGRRGSDDTIFDSIYYLMMMRRNRAVGGWPVKSA